MTEPNQDRVCKAFEQYIALLTLEKETGTKTTRARNEILRALPDPELTAIAVLIHKSKGAELTNGNPRTK